MKDKLDDLGEGYTRLAYVYKFLLNITDPDYAEDVRTLERSGASLQESIKSICHV